MFRGYIGSYKTEVKSFYKATACGGFAIKIGRAIADPALSTHSIPLKTLFADKDGTGYRLR